MKPLFGLALGALLAVMIACGGSSKTAFTNKPPPGDSGMTGGAATPRAEIDQLDQDITAAMTKLAEPRPTALPSNEPPQKLATQATAVDDTCKPAKTATCTDACDLKTSICTNAARICTIANTLGGNDAYANEKCASGSASCDAAKKRCCGCM